MYPSWQDAFPEYHMPRVMRVSELEHHPKGGFQLAKQAEEGASIAAPVSSFRGKMLSGCSYAIPYAAALHGEICERYGQWEQNKYGLTPEEIQWAIINSASKNVINPDTGKPINLNEGQHYHSRMGFGMIDPLKADKLASELFAYKREHQLTTDFKTLSVDLHSKGQPLVDKSKSEFYEYKIAMPEAIWAHNILADVAFRNIGTTVSGNDYNVQVKGRRVYLDHEDATHTTNLSPVGTTNIASLSGTYLPKGAELTFRSELPLEEGYLRIHGLKPEQNSTVPFLLDKTAGKLKDAYSGAVPAEALKAASIAAPFLLPSLKIPADALLRNAHPSGLPANVQLPWVPAQTKR